MNGIWSQKKSDIPTEQTKLTQNSKTLTKMGERKRGGGLKYGVIYFSLCLSRVSIDTT